MNKVICTFDDGNVHTFTNSKPEQVRHWFEVLWGVEGMVSIALVIGGVQVAEKSLYRQAV
jgi:hypothetical protein